MKTVSVLGSTGSVGRRTLELLQHFPDRFRVGGLAARGTNLTLLAEQVRVHRPQAVALADPRAAAELARRLSAPRPEILAGPEGLAAVAGEVAADVVVSALVGAAGLVPTLAGIRAGRTIALANKETLVMAGARMTEVARQHGVRLLPVDSEHSAIFQCLADSPARAVRRLVLTASGGPFRGWTPEALAAVRPEQALRHPTWRMGAKITVDSATLMNKGLEIIEAHWLFGMPFPQIDVVVHPQSIVHSMVEFVDRSVLAQLGAPDMGIPILYALSYPDRLPCPAPALDLIALGTLTFEAPDEEAFPCLALARQAGQAGGTAPLVLNAANEVGVAGFLEGRCGFLDIPRVIGESLDAYAGRTVDDLSGCLDLDRAVRDFAAATLSRVPTGVAGR